MEPSLRAFSEGDAVKPRVTLNAAQESLWKIAGLSLEREEMLRALDRDPWGSGRACR